jgi:serine/threonine protein kinase
MSDLPDKESSSTTPQPAPCERCGKPFSVSLKFSVTSLFQTDPGQGLSRWQECCKCDAPDLAVITNFSTSQDFVSASNSAASTASGSEAPEETPALSASEKPSASQEISAGPPPPYQPARQPAQSMAPQVYMIGERYEVVSVIGKGTFGPIYRAKDAATGKILCLKMVSTPISRHRRVVKRLMQEVEKAKTLNHPNIVAIYDSNIDKSGRPFYVMDLIEPGSLKHIIKQEGFLDVPEVIDIFLDVCEALSYAHEHGILHRDLKPGNILLSGGGTTRRAKVCDFGIAKALPSVGSEAQEMTQSTDVFADPSCMSPEQCLGRRLDVRSDIYSMGCSMYEAIIGKKVFTGPNALSVVVQHFKAIPNSFDSVMYNCDIPPDVEAVVFKMLEKAPEHRYQELSQVIDDLRLLKGHKKPIFAYQKKKGAPKSLALPFGLKEGADTAERIFDIVLNKKKLLDKNQNQNWNEQANQQVAADISRLARKGVERNLPQVRLIGNDAGPDKMIARAQPGPGEIGLPPGSQPVGSVELEQKLKNGKQDIIRPNQMKVSAAPQQFEPLSHVKLPAHVDVDAQPTMQQGYNALHEVAPLYRASDLYPVELPTAVPELFVEEPEDIIAPIVTVEQAKREIPDYLLQISTAPGFITLPTIIALLTALSIIWIMMQMFSHLAS